MKLFNLILTALVVLIFISCDKESDFTNDQGTSVNDRERSTQPIDYTSRVLTDYQETALAVTQIIAFKSGDDERFKSVLVSQLFDQSGKPKKDAFVYPILKDLNPAEVDNFLQSEGITTSFEDIKASVLNDFPLMVVKTPYWFYTSYKHEDIPQVISLLESKPFGFIANVRLEESPFLYNAYHYIDGLQPIVINTKDVKVDFVPVIIKLSEFHNLYDPIELVTAQGKSLTDNDLRVFDENSDCHPNNFVENYIIELPFLTTTDIVVEDFQFLSDWRDLEIGVCGAGSGSIIEICDNGVDDDGDGLIDCLCAGVGGSTGPDTECDCNEICGNGIDDDCDGFIDCNDSQDCPCVEICDNDIDDDGDGLIDEKDSDCCSYYDSCPRGCVFETNYFHAAIFDRFSTSFETAFIDVFISDAYRLKLSHLKHVGQATALSESKKHMNGNIFDDICDTPEIPFAPYPQENPANIAFDCNWSGSPTTEFTGIHTLSIWEEWVWDGWNSGYHIFAEFSFLNADNPLIVYSEIQWDNDWEGDKLGEEVFVEVYITDADYVTTAIETTKNHSTELGIEVGLDVGLGGDDSSIAPGFSFENSTSVETTFSVQIEPRDYNLGNFAMSYCSYISDYSFPNDCNTQGISAAGNVAGAISGDTGAVIIFNGFR